METRLRSDEVALLPKNCTDLPNILQSQIHQSQLSLFADEVIVGVALYGMESKLAEQVLPLRKNLRAEARDKMWEALFTAIASADAQPTYRLFDSFTNERTLALYLQASASFAVLGQQSFRLPLPKNKVNLFFVVEGCHSLVNSSLDFMPGSATRQFPPAEILRNLDQVLAQVPVLSVNLTHLQPSNLCNHAFGIQLTQSQPFYPQGNGLADEGRQVVQGLFDRGVNVDVKHMSIKSRMDLYAEIDNGRYRNPRHLHCTHAGFTGIAFRDWPGYVFHSLDAGNDFYLELAKPMQTRNNPSRPGAPAFNLSTINLFNEEIAWIVQHGGMIGLSMDRRILGYVDPHDDNPVGRRADSGFYVDKEFFSKAEWSALGLGNRVGYLVNEDECVTEAEMQENLGRGLQARHEYYYAHVLLQLKHFLQVCVDAGVELSEAQKHIAIGSDYDGMINPFSNIASVEDLPELRQYLLSDFGVYLNSLRDAEKWCGKLDVAAFVEGLFYENGYRYLKQFFDNPAV